jgi:hypothetical protein
MTEPLMAPVSPGELIDKKTILDVKRERITSPEKLGHVEREWRSLDGIVRNLHAGAPASAGLGQLELELLQVNRAIWDLENTVRALERAQDFGPDFVATARRIYSTNDARAAIKRRINEVLGAAIVEVKEHNSTAAHGPAAE